MTDKLFHLPVLSKEVLEVLCQKNIKTFFDGTLGLGGHAALILEHYPALDRYVATELDPEHLAYAQKRLDSFKDKLCIYNTNFAEIGALLEREAVTRPLSILLDLGLCSNQVDQAEKGFSFQVDGPLKMSFSGKNAAEIFLNEASVEHLSQVLRDYGELGQHKRIAQRIVFARKQLPLKTTGQLKDIIEKATHPREHKRNLVLAFQAIRMEVNDELSVIKQAIDGAFSVMQPGDRLGIISYHSLEDRLVKQRFKQLSQPVTTPGTFSLHEVLEEADFFVLTKKPILPTSAEIEQNPRSRSAKLRIIERK